MVFAAIGMHGHAFVTTVTWSLTSVPTATFVYNKLITFINLLEMNEC